MELYCPSSVVEGGLVAQAVNCPSDDLPIGHPYCEYRDVPGENNSRTGIVGPNAREAYRLVVENADGGFYAVDLINLLAYASQGSEMGATAFSFTLSAGADTDTTAYVSGFPQYSKGTAGDGEIVVRAGNTSGPIVASCTISISDDDNSYYIGQRTQHPYGGTWRTTPHCFTHGCGWQ